MKPFYKVIIYCTGYVGDYHLCCAIALQFSKGVVTLVQVVSYIPEPELFHWELCLVCEKTAVFTPYLVIFITVTATTGVCT